MKIKQNGRFFSILLAVLFIALCSCKRETQGTANPMTMTWMEMCQTNETTIVNGSWEQAENSYAELRKGSYTKAELKLWIGLQIEILKKATDDPLKGELKLSAVQQMYNFPEASRPYASWLRDNVANNDRADKTLQEKAKQVLNELENGEK